MVATGGSTVQILLRYTVTVFRYCQSFCNQELFGNTLRTLLVCLLLSSEEIHGHLQVNLRSYPPSLYLDAGKENMIHLLVGSYVQKPDSGFFFDWSRNNTCGLLISCHISTRLPTRSWSENRMVQTKQVFARTSFLLKPRRISIYFSEGRVLFR